MDKKAELEENIEFVETNRLETIWGSTSSDE